jgi:nucleoside-diphosphate-sugar epimerase
MKNAEKKREKCLIVGCGDLGRRLSQQLDHNHYDCVGLRRSIVPNIPGLSYSAIDVHDVDALKKILCDDFRIIVLSMTPNERSDSGYQQAYVQTTQNLVAYLNDLALRPRLIIFVSSTAVYAQDAGEWVDEQSPTMPTNFSGQRLLEAEKILQGSGLNHVILRFSGIYGPGRYRLIEQVKEKRASASTHYTNRIHADDCARALAHLIELDKTKKMEPVYLASDSSPTPMIEVVSWIASQLNITDFLSADVINERGNKRISNRLLLDSGYQFLYPDFRLGYATLIDNLTQNEKPRH